MTKPTKKRPSKKPAKKPAKPRKAGKPAAKPPAPGALCGKKSGALTCTLHASHWGTHWDGYAGKSFGKAVPKPRKSNPDKPCGPARSKVRNPEPSAAARSLSGRAGEVGVAADALRPWPVFAPSIGRRRFAYVPWLARYYGLGPFAVVGVLRAWEAAGLAQLLVDDDRARVMAPSDRALCPRVAGGGVVVWVVFG